MLSFSRVFKLVNYTEEITNLLNDTKGRSVVSPATFHFRSLIRAIASHSLTFFAVPDKALQPPKKHHKHSNLGFNFDGIDPLHVFEDSDTRSSWMYAGQFLHEGNGPYNA